MRYIACWEIFGLFSCFSIYFGTRQQHIKPHAKSLRQMQSFDRRKPATFLNLGSILVMYASQDPSQSLVVGRKTGTANSEGDMLPWPGVARPPTLRRAVAAPPGSCTSSTQVYEDCSASTSKPSSSPQAYNSEASMSLDLCASTSMCNSELRSRRALPHLDNSLCLRIKTQIFNGKLRRCREFIGWVQLHDDSVYCYCLRTSF